MEKIINQIILIVLSLIIVTLAIYGGINIYKNYFYSNCDLSDSNCYKGVELPN